MTDIAIKVAGLGKRYRIGASRGGAYRYKSLRDSLSGVFRRAQHSTTPPLHHSNSPDTIWALRDVSFEIKQGEVVGIIGRNGAGKSTLLKILSRITEPTEGCADVYGRVGSLLEVGTGFHPELTGRENIYLNGSILGMRQTEIRGKFDEIMAFAEVEKFIDTPVKHYSSGMHVRLAFAVAAHLEPEILLVDEVLAVGDAGFQKKCLGKMSDVAQRGRTVIFVSHNMHAIQRICPRSLLIDGGRISMDGLSKDVIARYLAAGQLQAGERVWADPGAAPGDDMVRLKAVRVLDASGRVANEFSVRQPVCLEIEFLVLQPSQPHLDASFYLADESGNVLFVVGDFQTGTWQNHGRPAGLHRSRCRVPANLFNEGRITVTAGVATHPYRSHCSESDVISFRMMDDLLEPPGGARGHYARPWPAGALRPLLDWETDYVAAAELSPTKEVR